MKNRGLSIVTVNFGSKDRVLNLYKSILKFPPKEDWEMIVVDNPTKKDNNGKFLSEYFSDKKNVHVIQLAENLGYGEGNNEGAKFANGEFIAVCNPDTEVLKDTFTKLLTKIRKNSNFGIVVPKLQTEDGNILENCRKFPTIISLIKRRLFQKKPFIKSQSSQKKEVHTDWSQGSFWILRKEVYENLAGFDSRFFLFMEDIDFCRRVWEKGLKVVQVPESIAIHSPNRLSGGFILSALFRKTFWIHLQSAMKYFWKWR